MTQAQVSTKYQVVIPKDVRRKLGLKPGSKVDVKAVGKNVLMKPKKNKSKWLWPDDYIKNLKGVWRADEIDSYLEEERNSWD